MEYSQRASPITGIANTSHSLQEIKAFIGDFFLKYSNPDYATQNNSNMCDICLKQMSLQNEEDYKSRFILNSDVVRVFLQSLLVAQNNRNRRDIKSKLSIMIVCKACHNELTSLVDIFLQIDNLRVRFETLRLRIGENIITKTIGKSMDEFEQWKKEAEGLATVFPSLVELEEYDEATKSDNCSSSKNCEQTQPGLTDNDEKYSQVKEKYRKIHIADKKLTKMSCVVSMNRIPDSAEPVSPPTPFENNLNLRGECASGFSSDGNSNFDNNSCIYHEHLTRRIHSSLVPVISVHNQSEEEDGSQISNEAEQWDHFASTDLNNMDDDDDEDDKIQTVQEDSKCYITSLDNHSEDPLENIPLTFNLVLGATSDENLEVNDNDIELKHEFTNDLEIEMPLQINQITEAGFHQTQDVNLTPPSTTTVGSESLDSEIRRNLRKREGIKKLLLCDEVCSMEDNDLEDNDDSEYNPENERRLVPCSTCGKKFTNFKTLQIHMKKIHNLQSMRKVKQDLKSLSSSSEPRQPIKRKKSLVINNERYYECDICKSLFKCRTEKSRCESKCRGVGHKCPVCGLKTQRLDNMRRHQKRHC